MPKVHLSNIGLKLALAGLLWHSVAYDYLPQYQDKGMEYRYIFYPLAAAATYLLWRLKLLRGAKTYPYAIDLCLTFVVTFDLLGNTLNLYDSIFWWDDAMHLTMSVPWALIAGFWLKDRVKNKLALFTLVVSFGLTSHIIWELLEYMTFVADHPVESLSAYRDTMGDLILSLSGTYVGAWLATRL